MTAKRLDRIAWGRSGKAVAKSERAVLLKVLRKATKQGRVRNISPGDKDEPTN